MTNSIHDRTAAAFIADAAKRSDYAATQPRDDAECDAAIAAIEAGLIKSGAIKAPAMVYVEARTLAGDTVRRHGPFARTSAEFSNAYHAEECAALGHNRMRRHDDASCQRVYIMDAPVMVPQQVQQQQANAAQPVLHIVTVERWGVVSTVRVNAADKESAARIVEAGQHGRAIRVTRVGPQQPAMVAQQCQQQQACAGASDLFAQLATAEAAMVRWGQACRDVRKFQPIVRAEFGRAFDKREALKAKALYADPVRYARTYPGNAYGIRHLLPADMAARVEAAETDAEIAAAIA